MFCYFLYKNNFPIQNLNDSWKKELNVITENFTEYPESYDLPWKKTSSAFKYLYKSSEFGKLLIQVKKLQTYNEHFYILLFEYIDNFIRNYVKSNKRSNEILVDIHNETKQLIKSIDDNIPKRYVKLRSNLTMIDTLMRDKIKSKLHG